MDKQDRDYLKAEVARLSKERVDRGYADCDPENLTRRAIEAEEQGYPVIAQALIKFRDEVVNKLLGEGWTLDRIERATINWAKKDKHG